MHPIAGLILSAITIYIFARFFSFLFPGYRSLEHRKKK